MLGRAIRTDRYRLVDWRPIGKPDAAPVYEHYDYQSGAVETVNLAEKKPDIVVNLRSILARHPVPRDLDPDAKKVPGK